MKAVATAEAKAAKDKKADDNQLTLAEAAEDVIHFVTKGLPWFAVVVCVWFVTLAVALGAALWRGGRGVRVRAPASSEDLATRVAAAARVGNGDGAPPAKIITASDETESTTVADVAKVLRLPGTVPLGDLLKRPPFSTWLWTRVDVSGSIAGSGAVIELVLRKPTEFKRAERIAVDLGDIEDDEKTEVLALIGGAWLNAVLYDEQGGPVVGNDAKGLADHALFSAGAAWHAIGNTQVARACYAAMRGADPHVAPFAWAGSRLNEMMALKTEHRWLEAAQVANGIGDFPDDKINGDERLPFREDQLLDLLLRQRYLTAVLRVDHWYSVFQDPNSVSPTPAAVKAKALLAVNLLETALDERARARRDGQIRGRHALEGVEAAARIVVLSYRIATGGNATIEQIRKELGVGDYDDPHRRAVSAAGYYDAACAVSLLLSRATDETLRNQYTREALWLLDTATAATLEARRPRVREMAKADPMLDHLRQADPAGFAKALGEPPPQVDQPPSVADAIAGVVDAITG